MKQAKSNQWAARRWNGDPECVRMAPQNTLTQLCHSWHLDISWLQDLSPSLQMSSDKSDGGEATETMLHVYSYNNLALSFDVYKTFFWKTLSQ